ncbi:MAG: pyridoxal-phosphate dependent enzyme [Gemmatimonadaceae bacterium]|nr:pyridoxal-phosphate dependent enzyme [Gemmatimonadaceae bacterium]
MKTLNPSVLPAVSAVHLAAERLRSFLPPSRLLRSDALSEQLGVEVLLKLELENPTGSFKVRGAYNVLAGMQADERARGVVASSAGNHGLGVAYAAKAFDAPAVLYVPSTAPQVKKDGIRALGAIVNDDAPDYDAAMVLAKAHAAREGVRFINPCLGLDLLAGQGTVALELLSQCPEMRALYVCTGGGGLLGGVGAVLRREAPQVHVVGVQSVETHAMSTSVRAGHVVDTVVTPTLADGLAGQIDDDALHIGQTCADALALVTEAQIGETIVWFKRTTGLVAEGAGAVTLAALRHGAKTTPVASTDDNAEWHKTGPIVAIVSGRNIDPSRIAQLESVYQA